MENQRQSIHNESNVGFGDADDDDLEILEPDGQRTSKKVRKLTSKLWDNFSEPADGIVKCKWCPVTYAWDGSNYGTSTLNRHMVKFIKSPQYRNVANMMIDAEGKLMSRKIDPNHVREILSRAIISHDLPISFVEYKWIRELINYLYPDAKQFSRFTATSDIKKLYCVEREKLKSVMLASPSRICLTSDCWTSCTSEGYICLTAHFVDSNWKLNCKVLSFCKMEPPHCGVDLEFKVHACLKGWANDSMQNILKGKLSAENGLLCNGVFFQIRCCAHILNLIVQDGLKVANEAFNKIRDSIKYVKASEGRLMKFFECVREVGGIDTKNGLCLDVATRWNSTFMMLESAIKYKRAFSCFQLNDKGYNFAPTDEEWAKGEKMCEFLRPFYVITNLISGSSYPTSDLYFMQIWKIECLLTANVVSEDEHIKAMCLKMKMKFDKYWGDYSMVLAFGVVLDPRAKLGMIRYCFSQLDPHTCEEKIDNIRMNLKMLFGEYTTKYMSYTQSRESNSQSSSSLLSTTTVSLGGKGKAKTNDFNLYDVLQDWQSQTSNNQDEKSALDQYLDDPPLEFKYFPNLDVLGFWKDNKERWPALSLMACDILSIPITTVASESSFSIGGRVLTKYRSRLLGEHVEAIICTRNWLLGFGNDENELEEGDLAFKEESNVIEDDA